MTNPTAVTSGPGPTHAGPRAGRAPLRLHDPERVPALADVLVASDADAAWAALRQEWGDAAPVGLGTGTRAWLVSGYQTIVMLARGSGMVTTETGAWTSAPHADLPAFARSAFRPSGGRRVETASGAAHARLRAPLEEALDAADASEVGRVTGVVCRDVLDELGSRGGADLMREYVVPVTRRALGEVLGLDPVTGRQVAELAEAVAAGQGDSASLDELSFLLGGQAMGPGDGPTPAGLLARHPAYAGTDEVVGGILSLVSAASRGLQAWLGQALLRALSDEAFLRRLAGGRLGTDEALDEVLWDASPVTVLAPRFALKEGHLFGDDMYVEHGDAILLAAGAAAADPRVRGDAWDGLGNRAHLAWGAGAHRCPAPRQARLVVRTAVELLLREVEPVLTTDAGEIRWAPDLRFRRPAALPVTFRSTGP